MSELPKARLAGPLAVHVRGFREELSALGFSPRTARDHAYVLAQLSRRVAAQGIAPGQLTEPALARFVRMRQRKSYRRWRSRRSLRLLVGYLRRAGAIPPGGPEADGPVGLLLDAYRRYLVTERRLAPSTVRARMDVARRFLELRVTSSGLDLEALAAPDVTGFLLVQARLRSVGAVKAMASPLRCLLRFLFVAGLVPCDLAGAVPAAASPRLASLPRAVDAATVAALLASCDCSRPVGQRDVAILTLLTRLGLRYGWATPEPRPPRSTCTLTSHSRKPPWHVHLRPEPGGSDTGRPITCSPSSKLCSYAGRFTTLTPAGLRQHHPPPARPA